MAKDKSIEQKYRKLTDVEHVLLRPGRYIGAKDSVTAKTWVVVDGKMVEKDLTWNPGFVKLFDEIVSNSVDHSKRPEGKHLDTIKVNIDQASGVITVEDNGGIPVIKHKEYNEFIATMVFGYLRSGANFDDTDESDLTGQNGEGASLTNIFSTEFTVETCDGSKGFKQTWSNNMRAVTEPKIKSGGKGYTKVTYTPDYAHLKTTLPGGNYDKLVKRVYDIAGTNPRLKIYLNGERIVIKSFEDYVKLYVTDYVYSENSDWQIAITKSEDQFKHVSFVNTTETTVGGIHVDHISYLIANGLREMIKKKHKVDLKPSEIISHFHLFINARIIRPRYSSQTKENLITPVKEFGTSWEPDEKFLKTVFKSSILQQILIWVDAKARAAEAAALKGLNKEVDKANPRNVEKFTDANEQHQRHLCELYMTEGDSARLAIQNARGKNPFIGSFALRGKPLNIMDCETKEILENKEIKNIMLITGLKIGEKVLSAKQLRFGKIVMMSDQDLDGFHIRALLKNFFARFWPELFELGIIHGMNTPLVIATAKDKAKTEHEFFTDHEYEEWAKKAPSHTIKRYKGLGKFQADVFKRIINTREKYLVKYSKFTDVSEEALSLAFSGSRADDRKEWLAGVNYFAFEE